MSVSVLFSFITLFEENPLSGPLSIVMDSDNNRALVNDAVLDAVVAVNLTTGERTILTTSILGFDNALGDFLAGVVVDSENKRVLVLDDYFNTIVAVDTKTSARTVFSSNDNSSPTAPGTMAIVSGIALDSANNRALVTERSVTRTAVYTVDLATGDRSILSNGSIPDAENMFSNLEDVVIDSANNRALVATSGSSAVYGVNLTTGARSIL